MPVGVIETVDAYFELGCGRCDRFATPDCSTRIWLDGLTRLRRICLDAGLSETLKWAHPCFMHAGRNVAILGAFRNDVRLSFFHAALLGDPESVLETAGPNTQQAGTIRFTSLADVERLEPVLMAYLKEAMGYAEAGIVPQKTEKELELPDEIVEALDGDPELAEAFHSLTPGRQRSYALHVGSAKKLETRQARIAKSRTKILAGKGANER